MTKVCALCDAGFPARVRDEVAVPLVEIDGKPVNDTALLISRRVLQDIQRIARETLDDDSPSKE